MTTDSSSKSLNLLMAPHSKQGSTPRRMSPYRNRVHGTENHLMGSLIPRKVFVGGIAEETSEGDLKAIFAQHGVIQDIRIITDKAMTSKSGEPRRFAFIEFSAEEEVARVLEEYQRHELELHGRRLNVAQAYRKVATFGKVFTPSTSSTENSFNVPSSSPTQNPALSLQNSFFVGAGRNPHLPGPFPPYFPPYFHPMYPGYPYFPIPPFPGGSPPTSTSPQQMMYQPQFNGGYNVPTPGHSPGRENRMEMDSPLCNGVGGNRPVRERVMGGYNAEVAPPCGHRHGNRDHQSSAQIFPVQNMGNPELFCHMNGYQPQTPFADLTRSGMFMGSMGSPPGQMSPF